MKMKSFFLALVLLQLLIFVPSVFGYNPPLGNESVLSFVSPLTLGGTANPAGGPSGSALPGELTVNPALSGGEQRVILDVSYAGLYGAEEDNGYGNIINLGTVIPTSFAVFGGSLNFIQSPFDSYLPLGTSLSVNFSVSKDLTERFYAGIGISGTFGSGDTGIAANIGVLYNFGDVLFAKDLRVGVAVTGLGTEFKPKDATGIRTPEKDITGYPTAFTLRNGFSFLFLRTNNVNAGLSAGISLPRFHNAVFDFGAEIEINKIFFAKTGWTLNLLELEKEHASLLPTVALGVRLKIGSGAAAKLTDRKDWMQSELTPSVAYKQFDGGIHAVSAGATLKLGQKDEKGPEIKIEFPEED